MAIRSLRDIWVDANFKETRLHHLRIGQRAEFKVDMYGGEHTFEGRISGFTMGDWLDAGIAAAAKCNRQFCQGRPTFAGAD